MKRDRRGIVVEKPRLIIEPPKEATLQQPDGRRFLWIRVDKP